MPISSWTEAVLFFCGFLFFSLHCEQFNKSRWLCATAVLSFPTAATSTTTGWQAHYLSLNAEYCLTNETQIKLYKLSSRHRRARLERPQCSPTSPRSPPTDSFTTHLLHIQFSKALSATYVCAFVLKLPLFDFISLRHLFVDNLCGHGFTFSFDSQTGLFFLFVLFVCHIQWRTVSYL